MIWPADQEFEISRESKSNVNVVREGLKTTRTEDDEEAVRAAEVAIQAPRFSYSPIENYVSGLLFPCGHNNVATYDNAMQVGKS